MTEILSKLEVAIFHYKEGKLAAITHTNGHAQLLKVSEMRRKDYEEFYEADQPQK